MNNGFYNVAPRYTCGSPAMVTSKIALCVSQQEKESYQHDLSGRYGEEKRRRAELFGLRGIVEFKTHKGSGKKSGWEVLDLITNEKRFVLDKANLRQEGWMKYKDLDQYVKDEIEKNPPIGKGDFKNYGWFKMIR